MANSHLPNSHPDVTPDWKEFPFSRTSFIDSIQTLVVEGYNGTRYAGAVPQDWCAYGGHILAAHGGYCAAVLLTTAHRYYRDKYSNKGSLDPVHIHVEFFHPMPQGLFHVVIKQLHCGKMSMTIQAELVSPDTDRTTYSVAIVRLGKLLETDGNNSIQPASDPLPNRERHCGRWVNSMFYTFNPPSASVRSYCPNDGNSILWSPRFGGQHTRSHWSKLDDGGLFQSEHILLLVDLIPAIPFNYENDALAAFTKYMTPTVCLSVNFCSQVKGEEWLMTRAAMNRLHNGRFDMDVQVFNDRGNVVATSTQVVAFIPRTDKVKRITSGL